MYIYIYLYIYILYRIYHFVHLNIHRLHLRRLEFHPKNRCAESFVAKNHGLKPEVKVDGTLPCIGP